VTFYTVIAVAPSVDRYGAWSHGKVVACTSPAESSTEEQPPPAPQIEVIPDAKEPPPPPRFDAGPEPK
jgi:hypothetical protein